jgi:co-chaperonin GroES (HSP10)
MSAHFSVSAGPTLESQPRKIRPLGEQIIIRVIPPLSVGSIIIPDSAKGSTHQGEGGSLVHFVEAEVVAVGPGKRRHDGKLLDDLADAIRTLHRSDDENLIRAFVDINSDLLVYRADNPDTLIPLQVKPGDRILYHPSVQSFDRRIPAELLGLPSTEECYICNEQTSVLAVLERE